MNEQTSQSDQAAQTAGTANDHFKRSFSSLFWGSITAATGLHFAVIFFWPSMEAPDVSVNTDQIEVVDPAVEVEIPPPPEAIRRPATPVITTAEISEEITIEKMTFDVWDSDNLPPPPDEVKTTELSQSPQFVVHTQKPIMQNRAEVDRVLEREYPSLLKDAGIGGTTIVHLFIDEEGIVRNQLVKTPSPHKGLDDAALKIAAVARFSPAYNRDKPVALWIELPISFKAN